MFPHPRLFAVGLLLSVSAAATQPIHSSGRGGGPLVNLNVVVLDAAARPIVGARLTIDAEVRRTDGGGFVNFAVQGPVLVDIIAPGYIPKRVELPPGNHRVHLKASHPTTQSPRRGDPGSRARLSDPCGARENPTDNRLECARSIAARSVHWRACTDLGNDVACHRYVREVATALARASTPTRKVRALGTPAEPHQGWGWGLISKPRGQRQCSLTQCGPEVRGPGYAEDAIAYLPQGEDRKHWIGFDVVGGAGAPGASLNWNGPLPRREDNLWVPVP
jgi:hypothetical protein